MKMTTPATTATMTGILYNGGTPKRVFHLPRPVVTKQYPILVQIYAAGVNPVDAKYVFGDKLPDSTWTQSWIQWYTKSCIPGFDFSGVIVDIHPSLQQQQQEQQSSSSSNNNKKGNNNHKYQIGDAVFGTVPPFVGTFCQFQRVPVDQICPIPKKYFHKNENENENDNNNDNDNHANNGTLSPPPPSIFVKVAALPLVGLSILQCFEHQFQLPHPASPAFQKKQQQQQQQPAKPKPHILVIGASGGTGHYAVWYVKHVLQPTYGGRVVGICSARNHDWVKNDLGADQVLDYHIGREALQQALQTAVQHHGPFTAVLDTVTSAKRQDQQWDYESLIRHGTPGTDPMIMDPKHGKYVKLGGPTSSWFAAGVKRSCFGLNLFWSKQSELFWVRFPQSAPELAQLVEGATTSSNPPPEQQQQPPWPWIAQELDFYPNHQTTTTTQQEDEPDKKEEEDSVIQQAFGMLLGRRTCGKIVLNFMNQSPIPTIYNHHHPHSKTNNPKQSE